MTYFKNLALWRKRELPVTSVFMLFFFLFSITFSFTASEVINIEIFSRPLTEIKEHLNNPTDATKLLRLISLFRCKTYNYKTGADEADTNLVRQRNMLIKLVLAKGADPNDIEHFSELPSPELAQILLENSDRPMDPAKLIHLVATRNAEHNVDSGILIPNSTNNF